VTDGCNPGQGNGILVFIFFLMSRLYYKSAPFVNDKSEYTCYNNFRFGIYVKISPPRVFSLCGISPVIYHGTLTTAFPTGGIIMPALELLKEKLQRREIVFGSTFSAINNLYIPKIFKGVGVDYMLFDCEHGNFMPELAVDMLQMCRACDLPTIIRVQDCEYHCISKCMDMGADGVLIPRTETEEQVKLAIASMRFYPRGRKGAGGIGLLRPGEDCDAFNNNRLLFLQIESPLGVQNLDGFLTKYGDEIAGIIIGPCDMGIMSGEGLAATSSPKVVEQIRQVIATCRRHEKSIGMYLSPGELRRWIGEGMNILWCGSDQGFMAAGCKNTLNSIADLR